MVKVEGSGDLTSPLLYDLIEVHVLSIEDIILVFEAVLLVFKELACLSVVALI